MKRTSALGLRVLSPPDHTPLVPPRPAPTRTRTRAHTECTPNRRVRPVPRVHSVRQGALDAPDSARQHSPALDVTRTYRRPPEAPPLHPRQHRNPGARGRPDEARERPDDEPLPSGSSVE